MKTKNKLLAAVEIAIVLCSVLFMALPAIAAGQTTQKVSATEVTTASEDDYVLGIYGNANEDDTIDMRDLTYVKLIFFGKKPETELADAKYDGKINPLDFIQIKLIIVGKEKELTIVDAYERIVTVKKPIERAVMTWDFFVPPMRVFGTLDKIVGVADSIPLKYPELSKLPSVGGYPSDYEAILSLNPDTVLVAWTAAEDAEKLPGIPVVSLSLTKPESLIEELVKLSYIFDKRDKASYYIDDFHDKYVDLIKERIEGLSEEEKPKVYVERWTGDYYAYLGGSGAHQMINICGGRNIFADILGNNACVNPEEVLKMNPDVIIKQDTTDSGYNVDDPAKIEVLRKSIMNRPELAKVTAVKNGKVYIMGRVLCYGMVHPVALAYWAKWFHPDLFEDLDPQAIHQEYLTEFQGLDYDLDEHGVFAYHPEEHPNGN